MKRRRFLQLTAGGLVMAGAGGGVWLWRQQQARERHGQAWLMHLARDMSGVAVIGRAWLSRYPGIDPTPGLLDALGVTSESMLSRAEFVEMLGERIETDLAEDRLFQHHGWWLSQTEAQLAALHVALLDDRASEVDEPTFENARRRRIVLLGGFNPDRMTQGEQLIGERLPPRVIWFGTGSRQPPWLIVVVDGDRIPITPRDHGFSIQLSQSQVDRLQARPGEHEVWLYDPVARKRQLLGQFVIEPATEPVHGFCWIDNWGPRQTSAGKAFNVQPDGSAAFWVQVACVPDATVLVLDGVELPTTVSAGDGLVTARVPDATLYVEPGTYRVELLDRDSGAVKRVGEFLVHE